jgi:hypothetical protein
MTIGRRLARALALCVVIGALAAPLAGAQDEAPPNVFISPAGQPFRAKLSEPYPIAVWFKQADKNGDGRIDRAEFLADAEAFFKRLDVNGDGVLDNLEIARYERQIAPEILGFRVEVGDRRGLYGGRIWNAQYGGAGGMGGAGGGIDPGGGESDSDSTQKPIQHDIDETGQGASPYSLFAEPEPVMAADEQLDGRIRKAAFLRLAGRHFEQLDQGGVGYLVLSKLPKTAVQTRVERIQHVGRH